MIELFDVYDIDETFGDVKIQKRVNSRIIFSAKGNQSWTWPIVAFDGCGKLVEQPTWNSDLDFYQWDYGLIRNRPTIIVSFLFNTVIYYFEDSWIRKIIYDQTYCTFNSDNIFFTTQRSTQFVDWDSKWYSALPITQGVTIDCHGDIYSQNQLIISNTNASNRVPLYWFVDKQYINICYTWTGPAACREWKIFESQNHKLCHLTSPHIKTCDSDSDELVVMNENYTQAFKIQIEGQEFEICSRYRSGKLLVSLSTGTRVFGSITMKNAVYFNQETRKLLIYYLWIVKHDVVKKFIPKLVFFEKIFPVLVSLPEIS